MKRVTASTERTRSAWRASCWNERFPHCSNCGNNERPRRTAGYCSACWPAAKRLREVAAWNPLEPRTFKGAGFFRGAHAFWDLEVARKFAQAAKRRCEERLRMLRAWEQMNRGEEPIDGVYLEYLLDRVGDAMHCYGRRRFHGYATTLEEQFTPKARALLHYLLTSLLLNRQQQKLYLAAYRDANDLGRRKGGS